MSELVCVWVQYAHLKFVMDNLSQLCHPVYGSIEFYVTDFIPIDRCDYDDIKGTLTKYIENPQPPNQHKLKMCELVCVWVQYDQLHPSRI